MKKKFLLTALAPVIAALFIIGCPSDPDPPPPRIENPDFLLEKGIVLIEHTTPIEAGKTYEVVIDVTKIDHNLWGCHFQGELYYTTDDGKKYLQANNVNAKPQNISDYGRKYRVTLTAGNMGSTSKEETDAVQKEGYTLTGGTSGYAVTAPAGATQFLRLITKTPRWYKMGVPTAQQEKDEANDWDNWDIDYYDAGIKSGFIGTVTVRLQPTYTYADAGALEVNDGKDATSGKGNIIETEYEKLFNLPEGSRVEIKYTVPLVASGGGGSSCQPGWGFAEFGTNMEEKKIRDQNLNVDITVPSDAPTGSYTGTAYVLVEDILAASDPNWTFLNVYNGASISSMKIEKATLVAVP